MLTFRAVFCICVTKLYQSKNDNDDDDDDNDDNNNHNIERVCNGNNNAN
jgi:hypothetical protein